MHVFVDKQGNIKPSDFCVGLMKSKGKVPVRRLRDTVCVLGLEMVCSEGAAPSQNVGLLMRHMHEDSSARIPRKWAGTVKC